MSNISVLIVGAGPTGLMMAYQLARHGISFRIIDKNPGATETSNAAAIQTRTLEIFKQVGLIDEFLRVGQPCKALCFYDNGKEFARLSFASLASVYHYILAIPQASTENIINSKLDDLQHSVERSRELVDVKVSVAGIEANIQHHDGVHESIHCEWLIGCDGAHSVVRAKCGFTFPGDDLKEQFVVADAELDSFLRHDQIHIFNAKGYVLGAFPLGSHDFRLGGNLNLGYPRKLLTDNDVKHIVNERSHGLLTARAVKWISPFWIHSKMADKMRIGNVFLAGDAAHIHSPLGGQGMNTGLQDVHNLAWKLALVIQGRADAKLLDTYEQERYPIIKEVVDNTERFTRFMIMSNPMVALFRKYLIKAAMAIPFIARRIMTQMTQLSIHYRQSIALDPSSHGHRRGPAVGERAPDVMINASHDFYHYLNDTYHHVLCFVGDKDIFKMVDVYMNLANELTGPYKDVVKLHLVTPHALDEPINQIHDDTNAMHQLYQITQPTIMVVRPDGYIGYHSHSLNTDEVKQFFARYLT